MSRRVKPGGKGAPPKGKAAAPKGGKGGKGAKGAKGGKGGKQKGKAPPQKGKPKRGGGASRIEVESVSSTQERAIAAAEAEKDREELREAVVASVAAAITDSAHADSRSADAVAEARVLLGRQGSSSALQSLLEGVRAAFASVFSDVEAEKNSPEGKLLRLGRRGAPGAAPSPAEPDAGRVGFRNADDGDVFAEWYEEVAGVPPTGVPPPELDDDEGPAVGADGEPLPPPQPTGLRFTPWVPALARHPFGFVRVRSTRAVAGGADGDVEKVTAISKASREHIDHQMQLYFATTWAGDERNAGLEALRRTTYLTTDSSARSGDAPAVVPWVLAVDGEAALALPTGTFVFELAARKRGERGDDGEPFFVFYCGHGTSKTVFDLLNGRAGNGDDAAWLLHYINALIDKDYVIYSRALPVEHAKSAEPIANAFLQAFFYPAVGGARAGSAPAHVRDAWWMPGELDDDVEEMQEKLKEEGAVYNRLAYRHRVEGARAAAERAREEVDE